jgi:hypothetical protein
LAINDIAIGTEMIVNKNPSFCWLRLEIETIKSKQFHIFDQLSGNDFFYEKNGRRVSIKGDYADFLNEFGWARLFCDHNDSPEVMVYPLKEYRYHACKNGKTYIGFGDRGYQHVCFDEALILNGYASGVYTVSQGKAIEICSGFSEWLVSAYSWQKSKYSKKRWQRIVDGPMPFSKEEMDVVEARRLFRWKLVGFDTHGDALFEVENNSTMILPYLSIGVRDIQQKILIGGAWLNVGNIKPGNKGIVKQDCYKDQIPPEQLEVFPRPDPIPEKKEAYWEFGQS